MKKRNQLVSGLLAGMLIGGLASTTVWADDDQLNNSEIVAETTSVPAEETAAPAERTERAASAESTSSSADDSQKSEQTDNHTSTPDAPASEQSVADEPSSDPSSAAEDPTSDPSSTPEDPTSDPSSTPEDPSASSDPTSNPSTTEDPTSDPSSTPENPEQSNQLTKEEQEAKKKAEEEAKKKAEEEARARTAAAESERRRNAASSVVPYRANSSYNYGSVNRAVLTPEQKLQNLKAGFQKITKALGLVTAPDYLNIREGKGTSSRVIGTIAKNGLLYILSDTDDDWVYVESGDVRGFVFKQWLKVEEDAVREVEALGGEEKLAKAKQVIDPLQNQAFRYSLNTTYDVPVYYGTATTADRAAIIAYAETFLGGRYVWGGEDPNTGADCSGYVRYVYNQFGISLPRTSYEQCYVGTRMDAKDAKPGDLIFYARNGVVYHVLMYIGDGKAVNAQSSATGIVISDVNYDKACWACSYINDDFTSTQASALVETGKKAYNGDEAAQQQIIESLAKAADKEWVNQGFLKSVLIAQVIQESGWLSFSGAADGGIQPEDNNILGMNKELLNDQWTSPWKGTAVDRNVPQYVNGRTVMGVESMRAYEDIEACMEDYAAFKIGIHPELKNSTNVETVVNVGLEGYATDPTYQESIKKIIEKYNLTQYDVISTAAAGNGRIDNTAYTQEQLELIWAVVAQEDDTSYDGALAVVTSAMNRADRNYGGYGQNVLAQLTADGQYCYSPKVSNPAYYQRRLGGNVPDFVKQAVSDCLTKGIRSHGYTSFRGSNEAGRVQIGSNYYFNE